MSAEVRNCWVWFLFALDMMEDAPVALRNWSKDLDGVCVRQTEL